MPSQDSKNKQSEREETLLDIISRIVKYIFWQGDKTTCDSCVRTHNENMQCMHTTRRHKNIRRQNFRKTCINKYFLQIIKANSIEYHNCFISYPFLISGLKKIDI